MTPSEAKDQVARNYGFNNWWEIEDHPPFMWEGRLIGSDEIFDELLKLYASEKVKEALKLAADKSQEMIYDRKDTQILESGAGLILRDFQVCYATPKQSILSLADELIDEINKEG